MSQRFQIEDLVVQDQSGVVFRALDTETGREVALRRFFPFGGKGGGLDADEQIAYNIAVKRLAGVSHPALRSVICGGCDVIDGMPFIATEWVEGKRLYALTERAPLALDQVIHLLHQVLEVCQLLSQALEDEAIWVETDLQAIVVGAEGSGRGITFWILPLRLLGRSNSEHGFTSIITLTEEVMVWHGKGTSNQVAVGLERWLKWLRDAAPTTSLQQVREMLVAYVDVKPPAPTKHLVHHAARPVFVSKNKKKSGKWLLMAAAALTLTTLGLGGWFLIKQREVSLAKVETEAVAAWIPMRQGAEIPLAGLRDQDDLALKAAPVGLVQARPKREISPAEASQRGAELLQAQQNSEREMEARRIEIAKRDGVFEIADHAFLLERKNTEVSLRGEVREVQFSDKGNGATLYLDFSHADLRNGVRGFVMRKDLNESMTLVALQKLVGRNILLRGKVSTPTSRNRPEIEVKDLAAIQEVK